MADQQIIDAAQAQRGTEALERQAAAVNDLGKQSAQSAKEAQTGMESLRKTINNLARPVRLAATAMSDFTKKFSSANRDLRTFSKLSTQCGQNMEYVEGAIHRAALKGKKDLSGIMFAVSKLTETLVIAAQETRNTAAAVDNATIEYKRLYDVLTESVKKYEEEAKALKALKVERDKLLGSGPLTSPEDIRRLSQLDFAISTTAETMKRLEPVIEENKEGLKRQGLEVGKLSQEYLKWRDSVVTATSDLKTKIQTMREASREFRKLQGGPKALVASLEGLMDKKLWTWMEYLTSGAAIIAAFKHIDDATKRTAGYMKQAVLIEQQMGAMGTKTGSDWKAGAAEAQTAMEGMANTAGSLYMDLGDVQDITEKIRLGVKIDRDGKLATAAVTTLTKEVAVFSKVTGVDAGTAVDMLDKRMKQFNMTALEAQADMAGMRTMLAQMTVGVKRNIIPMDEMIKSINEASDASNSYIVDTRLLAQAQRAAANAAAGLGASQKLSKDVVKSVGKMVGELPDHITIPAGQEIFKKLMGPNAEEEISKLDAETQKLVRHVLDATKKGDIHSYQAQRILMENLKGTEMGMDATIQQVMKYDNKIGPMLLKQWGLAETESAGLIMYENMRKATEEQKRLNALGIKNVSVAELMDDKYERMREALKGAATEQDKLARIKALGATDYGAQKYLKEMEAADVEIAAAKKRLAAAQDATSKAAAEKEIILLEHKLKQSLNRAADPLEQAVDLLEKKMPKVLKIDAKTKIDMKDFTSALNANASTDKERADKIMKAMGWTTDTARTAIMDSLAKNEQISAKWISDIGKVESEGAKKQEEQLKGAFQAFDKGIIEGLKKVIDYWLPWFQTPLGEMTKALGLLALGIAGIWVGALKMLRIFEAATMRGTRDGVIAAGGGGQTYGGGGDGKGGGILGRLRNLGGSGKWGMEELMTAPGSFGSTGTLGKMGAGSARMMSGKAGNLAGVGMMYHGVDNFMKADTAVGKFAAGLQGAIGGLAQLPGPVGAVAKAFSVGYEVGTQLNNAMEALFPKYKEMSWGLETLAENTGSFGRWLKAWIGGNDSDDVAKKDEADQAKLATKLSKKYNISLDQYTKDLADADKNKQGITQYLDSKYRGRRSMTGQQGALPPGGVLPQGANLTPDQAATQAQLIAAEAAKNRKPFIGGAAGGVSNNPMAPAGGVTMTMDPNSLNANGSITVKIDGLQQTLSQSNKMREQATKKN